MWSRKLIDDLKSRKIWWLEPWQQARIRKNRKQCSCWMCGNPRRHKLTSPKGEKERNLRSLHNDEIHEYMGKTPAELIEERMWDLDS